MSWLSALCLGLAKIVPGPLGGFGVFVEKLYSDQRTEERNKKIQDAITKNDETGRAAVGGIFELKGQMAETQRYLTGVFQSILEIRQRRNVTLTTPETLESFFATIGLYEDAVFARDNILTSKTFRDQMIDAFGHDIDEFKYLLTDGGYDISLLSQGVANQKIIRDFCDQFKGNYTPQERVNIFQHLANRRRGFPLITQIYKLLQEQAQQDDLRHD